MEYSVQTGWGAVKENKAATALGANWTHSLDACIVHNTVARYEHPCFTVHDCFYGRAGELPEFVQIAKEEYLFTVTCMPMENLMKENDIDVAPPALGTAKVEQIMFADYPFS
jgi:DNA-directed RNA polymerase